MSHFNVSQGAGLYALLAIFFVALNAFFVAAEFAIVKIRHTRLRMLASRGNPVARVAQVIVNHLDAYLSATQLGITLASLGLGWIGEPAFAKIITGLLHFFNGQLSDATLHSVSLTIAFLFISALHIILGELVPKSLAIRSAEKICLIIAVPLRVFYVTFFPFLWVLNGLSNLTIRILGFPLSSKPMGGHHSEEELKQLVEDSYEEGAIVSSKPLLLDKALEFSHKTVRDIMIPESKMVCFYLDDDIHENLERAKESGHTRFPLRENRKGKVFGFVHMKDVIWHLEHGEVINLYDLARPIIFFRDDSKLDAALVEFQRKTIHMAVVQREKGRIIGLITLEDVIEQLVGEIKDEFD